MMKLLSKLALIAAMSAASWAQAVDGLSVEFGKSDSSGAEVKTLRVAGQWMWGKKWLEGKDWHLGGYWDVSAAYWDNSSPQATHSSLVDIGLTPTFRFARNKLDGISPYFEAAIGIHLLSQNSVSANRRFGEALQFGDHIGFGVRFGDKGEYDLGYRFQHISNADIKKPNDGIDFHQIRFAHHF